MLREWRGERRYQMEALALVRRDLINFSFCRPKEPVSVDDLLPPDEEAPAATRPRRYRMTAGKRQEIVGGVRRLFESLREG